VQGLPYAEIATALECSEVAARARVSDALKKVKAAVA
jgi:DNA-directed RNA polymerase specialized sigma24 family protein